MSIPVPDRITLKKIAMETGLSRMAVSLALRNKAGVSEATRAKVQEIAARLGYSPDPEVANLLARIRAGRSTVTSACIALISAGPAPSGSTMVGTERKYVEGVVERAKIYGYSVEEFHLGKGGLNRDRLASILWNRGIEGVVIRPLQTVLTEHSARSIQFDFDRFSSVAISETLESPELDRALHDQYTAMMTTLTKLRACGYSRIGVVIEEALNRRVNGRWSAAFLQFHSFPPVPKTPSPFIPGQFKPEDFGRWFDKFKPDAIVSVDRCALRYIQHFKLRIPEDVGYASLDLDGEPAALHPVTGIDQNSRLVGAAAVDMLVVSMQRRQRGVPIHPMRMEVEGEWREGRTTRSAGSSP